jgi:Tfp pilus assembly protein PilO
VRSVSQQTIAVVAFGVLAVLVAAIGFLAVVHPQQTKARTLDTKIANAQTQYVAMHEQGHEKPDLRTAELFQLSRAMPESDDMPGILVDLSRLSGVSSVTLTAVQPSPRIALPDGSSALPIRVTVNGTWTQVAGFIRRLNAQVRTGDHKLSVAGRLFDIDTIQITSGASGSASQIEAVLTMSAFDYGAPPSPTAALGSAASSTTTTTTTPTSSSQQAAGAPGAGS